LGNYQNFYELTQPGSAENDDFKPSRHKKHFGATPALDGVDLDLQKGKVHALIGGTAPEKVR